MLGGIPLGSTPLATSRAGFVGRLTGLASTLAFGLGKLRYKPRFTGRVSTLAYGQISARRVRFLYALGCPSTLVYGPIKIIMWQTLEPESADWVVAWTRIPTDG